MAHGAQWAAGTGRTASLGRAAVLMKSRANQLRQRQNGEARVPGKIAAPQPPGFGAQTEQPFQTALLHPKRRLRLGPSEEVKRGAYAQHHGVYAPLVRVHPVVLLGTAEPNEQNAHT